MANKPNGVIYIGVTDNINERVKEHKCRIYRKSFTARYNCENLVFLRSLKMEKKLQ